MNALLLYKRQLIATVTVLALAAVVTAIYTKGRRDALDGIEEQNTEAGAAASDAASAWRACYDARGVYIFETGECIGIE